MLYRGGCRKRNRTTKLPSDSPMRPGDADRLEIHDRRKAEPGLRRGFVAERLGIEIRFTKFGATRAMARSI